MTTVYLVTTGEYSDYQVRGVYSSEERAGEVVKLYSSATIETYELDVQPAHPTGKLWFEVQMKRDGSVEGCQHLGIDAREYVPENQDLVCEQTYHLADGEHRYDWMSFEMWARDKEHAVKIANERRASLIAANLWGSGYHSFLDGKRQQ